MQLFYDHLVAILIAAVLFLSLQVGRTRSSQADVDQVTSHSLKAKTLIFGQWVEDDVLSIGANFGVNMYRFEVPTVDPVTGNTTRWEFFSDSTKSDGTKTRIFKRYRLEEKGLATFDNPATTFQLYRVARDSIVVDYDAAGFAPTLSSIDEADWNRAGESIETVSFFTVDLLDRFGETPWADEYDPSQGIDVYSTDYIRVRFGVVPEHVLATGDGIWGNKLRELYWSKTLKVRPYWVPPPSQS